MALRKSAACAGARRPLPSRSQAPQGCSSRDHDPSLPSRQHRPGVRTALANPACRWLNRSHRRLHMSIITERDGPVAIITINRPQARNAVDPETAAALYDAFCDAERDDAVLATVLTGAEGAFCAGRRSQGRRQARPRFRARRQEASAAGADGPDAPARRSRCAGAVRLALQAADRRDRRPCRRRRARTRADGRHARRVRDRGLRRLLPPLGRAADRWRHAAPAAHRRPGPRHGHDPHRPRRRCARKRSQWGLANRW